MNFSSSNKSVDLEKPRRLEEETAIYLSGLEPQLEDAENNDNIGILIDNVLDEIKQRTASAASDRRTNFIIEKICNFANLTQLVEVIKRCSPYVLFLSQNRHSSHVVQGITARLCHLLRAGETFDVDLDALESVILTFVQPILSNFAWMAGEISGSHVLRSMICLLSGMPLISERKSTSSKHQHSVARAEPLEKLIVPDLYYIDSKLCFQVPDAFHTALYNAVESSLLGQTDSDGNVTGTGQSFSHELQVMISDTSCCAAVVILLRVLYTPDLVPGGPELAEQIVVCALDWSSPLSSSPALPKSEKDTGANVFYAMGGDKSGSYFLEAVVECCSVSFLMELVQRSLLSRSDETIQEYVEDNVANFVIQSVLKRLTSVFTLNNKRSSNMEEYDQLMDVAMKLLSSETGLMKPDLFKYLIQCKGGVVLWMLKLGRIMSLPAGVTESELMMSVSGWTGTVGHTIAMGVLTQWTHLTSSEVDTNESLLDSALDAFVVKKLECSTSSAAEKETNTKPVLKKPSYGATAKAVSNKPNAAALLVARLLGAMLALDGSVVAEKVCRMLCRLPHSTLLPLACSGPMSRSVLDVFFESKSNGRERSIFLTTFLMPHLSVICAHPIAHHTLRKCFESASSVDKERVVEAIVVPAFYSTITHTREGTAVIRFTQCDLYSRNSSEWKALIVRQKKAQVMLLELDSINNTRSAPPAGGGYRHNSSQQKYEQQLQQGAHTAEYSGGAAGTGTGTDADAGDASAAASGGAAGGRKRKRKRTSSKKDGDNGGEDNHEDDDDDDDDDGGGGAGEHAVVVAAAAAAAAVASDSVMEDIFGDQNFDKKKKSKKDKKDRNDEVLSKEAERVSEHRVQKEELQNKSSGKKAEKDRDHKKKKSKSSSSQSSSGGSGGGGSGGGSGGGGGGRSSAAAAAAAAAAAGPAGRADFQKIKMLSSAKMMSIKRLTENL